jgi:hypothetical protein
MISVIHIPPKTQSRSRGKVGYHFGRFDWPRMSKLGTFFENIYFFFKFYHF